MTFNIVTIFPDIIFQYCNESILRRGQDAGHLAIRAVNLRDFTTDRHKTVDDTPYGGGAGMVLKPVPVYEALRTLGALKKKAKVPPLRRAGKSPATPAGRQKSKVTILLSPRGRQFDQRLAEEWSHCGELTIVCGRYEGVDQRVAEFMVDEEVSVGPYVLSGGELPALVIVEAVSRLIPGVLGNPDSLQEETYGTQELKIAAARWRGPGGGGKHCELNMTHEYPHYTKPAIFRGWKVPDVLLSGDHKRIEEWRRRRQMERG